MGNRKCFIRARVTEEVKAVIKDKARKYKWSESTLIESVVMEFFKDDIEKEIEKRNQSNN